MPAMFMPDMECTWRAGTTFGVPSPAPATGSATHIEAAAVNVATTTARVPSAAAGFMELRIAPGRSTGRRSAPHSGCGQLLISANATSATGGIERSQCFPRRPGYRAVMVERITRSGLIARLGGLAASVAGLGAWRAAAAPASGTVSCVLTPELTEGPYYLAGEKLRRNITEGRPGTRLDLRLGVLDATTCRPIPGAAVDIWHADALGVYSGFGAGSASRTFMRGVQRTDRNGLAVFRTVYPGWYQGRTVHIHVKVHVGGNVVHTGQLFFSDTLTDAVYRRSPYARRPNRTTRNAQDGIFQSGGRQSVLTVRRSGSGYVGSIAMGVRR